MLPVLKVSGWGSCLVAGNVNALPLSDQVVLGAFRVKANAQLSRYPGINGGALMNFTSPVFPLASHSFITAILYILPLVSMMNGSFHHDASPDYLL